MLESPSHPQPVETSAADSSVSFTAAPKRHRKIAILGFGETVKDCPWQDPSWELWAMNGFWRAAEPDFGIKVPEERYSLWLDMHTIEFTRAYGKAAGFDDKQERWLEKQHPFPVLMLDADPAFPSVQPFPLEAVVQKLRRDYFTSTVAYALALALAQDDVAAIGLWGIDLTHSSEYADQRPCAEYWIARAEAIGIVVTVPEQSALLKQRHRYGYEPEDTLHAEMVKALQEQVVGISKAIAQNEAEAEKFHGQALTDSGAVQMANQLLARLEAWRRGGRI